MNKAIADRPVRVAVVGAGHRSVAYASHALRHPDEMQIVAIAEPRDDRRAEAAKTHSVSEDMLFSSYEQLLDGEPIADAVINGTMDQMHYTTTKPLIQSGYNVLLEKPIAQKQSEVVELIDLAKQHNRVVMICHVLRYAPFYQQVKQLVSDGAIGRVISMHTKELVSYHHMATGFVRGRWNKREANPMLLAKCCHDLDIIAWLMSGVNPTRVSSAGSLIQFREENAPDGATDRCMDCPHVETCAYSAKKIHVDGGLWQEYAFEHGSTNWREMTREQKLESLRHPNNMYARCVWKCDNDVVDHQSVLVEFENGATASHDMFTATAKPGRTIHIIGDKGELEGELEDGIVYLRTFNPLSENGYEEKIFDVNTAGDGMTGGHGGGDNRLIADFVNLIRGQKTSSGHTKIEDSLSGHLIAFAADEAMLTRRIVNLTTRD